MLGLYIHYPFCLAKCPYCDFYSVGRDAEESSHAARYFTALERELALWLESAPALRGRALTSVYFGGGTPSLASPAAIDRVVRAVREAFVLGPDAEITLEANPGASDGERFEGYRRAGVNRLSIGVQSFSAAELLALGRVHSPDEARSALAAARQAGFANLGADLIFGIPGQTLADFQRNLEELLSFRPEHASIYGLTVYEGTPFEARRKAGTLPLPSDDEQAEMFLFARRRITEAGYLHYEISNYARPGFESCHNSLYWNGGDWIGLGPSAHSSLAGERSENPRSVVEWLQSVESGALALRPEEKPTPQAEVGEFVMLGLRQSCGVSLSRLLRRFGDGALRRAEPLFRQLAADGFVHQTADGFALTERGLLLADSIMARFF
ncbi:MAG: radical SAM family heme chaperone HemW [Candidatus Sumerlaeota bacterium]|nr:radical SAM family heme chaperone HemW [Candidatus Sumerlaeota bacterium]